MLQVHTDLPVGHGIYVHAPWCRVRCPYCAFYVEVERGADWAAWKDGIRREWQLRAPDFPGRAHSLYLGGGTPSLAPLPLLTELLAELPLEDGAEITLEANPGTVDGPLLDALRLAGVTRLSLGVQTFQPRFARLLNRGHTAAQSEALLGLVRGACFPTWSADLIFSLPGQGIAELDLDLEALLRAAPPHVSLSGLTFEPDTPFGRALKAGRLTALPDDAWAEQYERIVSRLEAEGYERYEVSNFALPGHRSRHNEAVWRGGAYAGLGPSAQGFQPDGARTANPPALAAWLHTPVSPPEWPSAHQAALDLLLSTMRHEAGLSLDLLAARSGHSLDPAVLRPLARAGLIATTPTRLRLLPPGYRLADGLIRRLAEGLVLLPPVLPPTAGPSLA